MAPRHRALPPPRAPRRGYPTVTAEIDIRQSVRHARPRERYAPGGAPVEPAPIGAPGRPEAGLEATAPSLRLLFEETATALGRVMARPEDAGPACRWEAVSLHAHDLPGLAGLWLDRLISLGDSRFSDLRREAIVAVAVDRVASPEEEAHAGRWELRARVGLRPYLENGIPRLEIRSASDRPLAVERGDASWTLRARLAF